jgi:3-methyladenine DNA glycosylase/8-oxoguanine DNA glycosylase
VDVHGHYILTVSVPGRAPRERRLRPRRPIDVRLTLSPLRHGPGDATVRLAPGAVWRAAHTPAGTVTMFVGNDGGEIVVRAWGAGADWAIESAPALVGMDDDDRALVPRDPVVAGLAHRLPGLRLARTGLVMETVVPTIVEQKVTSREAHRAWARIVRAWGEPAPGPPGLLLPPAPERLAATPYFQFHRFGIERRRADFIIGACRRAAWFEQSTELAPAAAAARLQAFRGIGPWTAGHVQQFALGDPDAVVVGDYHLPHMVTGALAGEPRGTDERMLELLAPYAGQRGRVQRLIALGGGHAPRHHLRRPLRDIASI